MERTCPEQNRRNSCPACVLNLFEKARLKSRAVNASKSIAALAVVGTRLSKLHHYPQAATISYADVNDRLVNDRLINFG
jgi:hypothetical protein